MHFSLIKASDLLLIDHNGKVIMGGHPDRQRYNAAAFTIHKAIHEARPDVDSVCHAHSPWGKPFAAQGRLLPMYTQDATMFYEDHGLYEDFGGVVLSDDESEAIVAALGNKKALILQNHGILTVGGCIESAMGWFIVYVSHSGAVLLP